MPNIVYVLTNALMPGLVKIGWTNGNVEARLKELSAVPGVPLPFQCHFAAEVDDAARTEKVLHELFSEYRVNPRREFFRIDAEKVVLAISIGRFTEVTPGAAEVDEQEKEAVEKEMARRPKLRLDAIGIRPGDTLKFSRDESVTAIVLENGKVQLDGEVLNLAPAALKVLHKMGYKWSAASGSEYWMYDGELLDERRRRMEDESNRSHLGE